jgi:uncharacterized protein YkwD
VVRPRELPVPGGLERPARALLEVRNACTCKYSCTLARKMRTTGRRLGAMIAAIVHAGTGALAADAALAGGSSPTSPAPCPGANLRPSPTDGPALATATLCLVNGVRSAHHLRPLHPNRYLGAVAMSQLRSMVRWDYFADVRPSGQTPMSLITATRYPAHAAAVSVGQNIAWGAGSHTTPVSIVAAWMASPPHREVMLTREFRDAGAAASATAPSTLGVGAPSAIYALELGVRRF